MTNQEIITDTQKKTLTIKRIGILTNTYPPIRNGVSMAVYGLEVELQKKGIEVFIATPHIDGIDYADNIFTFKALELPKDISADLKLASVYINKVKKYFAEKEIELLHTSDTLFGGIEGATIARDLGIPCIHTFHTLIEDYQMVHFPAYKMIIRKAIKEVCNSYDHVIAPSQKVYNYLLSLTTSPISQIYNVSYLNCVEFEETSRFDDSLTGISDKDFVFVTFCRLAKEKGLDHGIKTLAPIMKFNPLVKYVIAGDGPQKQELIELASQLGVQKQVIFVGGYNPSELQTFAKKSKAQVFLFTSLSENLPTNILEAMFLGLPVVAVDDPSVDYIVKHNYNGYKDKLENLFDHCIKLVYSEGIIKELSTNAKQTATDFLQKDIAQQHINLYNQTIQKYYTEQKESKLIDWQNILKDTISAVKKLIDF
jgi:1,2-diacylglycerol 3-alpha-glucosyltransferase